MAKKLDKNKIPFQIAWILMLFFIAWPVALFAAGWWVFLLPFEELHKLVQQAVEFLETIMTWPRQVGKAIINGSDTFPSPW